MSISPTIYEHEKPEQRTAPRFKGAAQMGLVLVYFRPETIGQAG